MSQQVNTSRENTSSIHDMWTKIETAIETTSEHMRRITENQIMSNAPSPIKKTYFENLYRSIAAAAETRATEVENQRKMADLKRRELDLQERSIQLGESLLAEEEKEEGKLSDDGEVDLAREQPTDREVSICGEENKSRWLLLMETGLVVEAHHLSNAECGTEFACLHNRDTHDFTNDEKFERFILKKTKATVPYRWDLLDETGTQVIDHIIEDEDQGPSKEWGPYGWYRHPSPSDVIKAGNGKTVYLSSILNN